MKLQRCKMREGEKGVLIPCVKGGVNDHIELEDRIYRCLQLDDDDVKTSFHMISDEYNTIIFFSDTWAVVNSIDLEFFE